MTQPPLQLSGGDETISIAPVLSVLWLPVCFLFLLAYTETFTHQNSIGHAPHTTKSLSNFMPEGFTQLKSGHNKPRCIVYKCKLKQVHCNSHRALDPTSTLNLMVRICEDSSAYRAYMQLVVSHKMATDWAAEIAQEYIED